MKAKDPTKLLSRQKAFIADIRSGAVASRPHLRPGGELTPTRALRVYQKGYEARLFDAIAANYEALWYVLGDARFAKLVRDYRKAHPSLTYNLNAYGLEMPAFVKKIYPKLPHLYQLALFETLLFEVFNAAEYEAAAMDFSRLKPERDRFVFQPGVRLFASEFRIYDLWRNRKKLAKGYSPGNFARPEFTLLYKRDHQHYFAVLTQAQFAIVKNLVNGKPLAAALAKSNATPKQVQSLFSLLANPGITYKLEASRARA